MTEQHHLQAEAAGERLDRFLSRHLPHLSRARLQQLIQRGQVVVNGLSVKPSLRLKPDDRVDVVVPPPEPLELEPEDIPINVVYQDAHLLVVDKPAGLTVHPGAGHPRHTLVNALLALCPDLSGVGGKLRPGIVHRLDKNTSGLMVVAKSDIAHHGLAQQLKEGAMTKKYLAMVWDTPHPSEGVIEAPVGRHRVHRQRMAVVTQGRYALTRYRVQEVMGDFSLLEVTPSTGRTHQIRVHLSFIGHPIVGDPLYTRRRVPFLERQFLHACFLGFQHPTTGERLQFTAPLPQDLEEALQAARV